MIRGSMPSRVQFNSKPNFRRSAAAQQTRMFLSCALQNTCKRFLENKLNNGGVRSKRNIFCCAVKIEQAVWSLPDRSISCDDDFLDFN